VVPADVADHVQRQCDQAGDQRHHAGHRDRGHDHDHGEDQQRRADEQGGEGDHRHLGDPERLPGHEAGPRELVLGVLDEGVVAHHAATSAWRAHLGSRRPGMRAAAARESVRSRAHEGVRSVLSRYSSLSLIRIS
jgi:hypothetical protein